MDGLSKFTKTLTPEEVRKIQEERKPLTEEEYKKVQENIRSQKRTAAEAFNALIDSVSSEKGKAGARSIYNDIKVDEAPDLSITTRKKLIELVSDLQAKALKQEKRKEITKEPISLKVDNEKAIFTFDYFDTIEVDEFNFATNEWENISKTPKPGFDRFNQSEQ